MHWPTKTTFELRGYTLDKHLKAIALSHQEALLYKPLKNTVLISYANYDHGKMFSPMPENVKKRYKAVLELPVNDIDRTDEYTLSIFEQMYPDHNYHVFDEGDYQKLHAFIVTYKDCHFIVHCDAGVSRSSATALYINYIYAPKDYEKLKKLGIYYPNALIFGYLSEGKMSDEILAKTNAFLYDNE